MDGDVIELETEGLGRLRFNVRDDLKRTWARETRLQRQEKQQEGTTPQLTGQVRAAGALRTYGAAAVSRMTWSRPSP